MRKLRRLSVLALVLGWVGASGAAPEEKVVLGVFLPTQIANGQQRFELSESLGAALQKSLGKRVVVKNFARYEDLAEASKRTLDAVVVETWAGVQLAPDATTLAAAEMSGEIEQRWAIVTHQKGALAALEDKRLAVPRGVKTLMPRFVSNVLFRGEFDTRKLKLIQVPNAESALQMLQAKSAGAAVVPLRQVPPDARVLYRSDRYPTVVALNLRGDADALRKAFLGISGVAPVDRFVATSGKEFTELRTLLVKGPPPKLPVMAESPTLRPDPQALVDMREVSVVLPSFIDHMEASTETPDD